MTGAFFHVPPISREESEASPAERWGEEPAEEKGVGRKGDKTGTGKGYEKCA